MCTCLSTIYQQVLFPSLVLGHHHDITGAAKSLPLQDRPVPLLNRHRLGLTGVVDLDVFGLLLPSSTIGFEPSVVPQFLGEVPGCNLNLATWIHLIVLDARNWARAPFAPHAVDAVLCKKRCSDHEDGQVHGQGHGQGHGQWSKRCSVHKEVGWVVPSGYLGTKE